MVGLFGKADYEEDVVSLRRRHLSCLQRRRHRTGKRLRRIRRAAADRLGVGEPPLPLAKISEIVTAAVDDWIGANEQPDDVTLVLARVR